MPLHSGMLKVKAQLCRVRARRHIVRSAERRKEVVQGFLVGDVDRRQSQAPAIPVALEQVVVANG